MDDILSFNEFNVLFKTIDKHCSWKVGLLRRLQKIFSRTNSYSSIFQDFLEEPLDKFQKQYIKLNKADTLYYFKNRESNIIYLKNVIEVAKRKEERRKKTASNFWFLGFPFLILFLDYRDSKIPYYNKIYKIINDFQPEFIEKELQKNYVLKDTIALMCETGMIDSYKDYMTKKGFNLNSMTEFISERIGTTRESLYPLLNAYSNGPKSKNFPFLSIALKKELNAHCKNDEIYDDSFKLDKLKKP